jgi:ligand-binding sensor domain-containing protein/AraC-like DNA-binding protein
MVYGRFYRFIRCLLPGYIALFTAVIVSASSGSTGRLHQRMWSTRDGLNQDTVNCMLRGPGDYLWLGTDSGLVRFDGVRFKNVAGNGPVKYLNKVTSLLVTEDGTFLVGTSGRGVLRLDRKKEQFTPLAAAGKLADVYVTALLDEDDNSLWIGTEQGLKRLSRGQLQRIPRQNGLPDNHVTALCRDSIGNLWVGTANGIVKAVPHSQEISFKPFEYLKGQLIHSILEQKNGSMCIATTKGVFRVMLPDDNNPGTHTGIERLSLKGPFNDGAVISLYEDREGILWFGTGGKGFGCLYPQRFTFYSVEHGLSHRFITALYQDRQGIMWIGTRGGGLNRFNENGFKIFTRTDGLASDWITALCGDGGGGLWVGTPGALSRFRNGMFRHVDAGDSLPDVPIRAMCVDGSGNLWIAAHGSGLVLYTPGNNTFRVYGSRDGLSNPFVSAVAYDSGGTLWVGTQRGLFRFENQRFQPLPGNSSLFTAAVSDIYSRPDQTLWIATAGDGIYRCKNGRVSHFKPPDSASFNTHIYSILEDNRKRLWLSSANGLFCIPSRRLLGSSSQGDGSYCCYRFDRGILNTAVFTGAGKPSGWKAADGSLWFPTADGITVIPRPDEVFNRSPQQVHIENIMVDNVSMKPDQTMHFPAGTRTLRFLCTAPHFTAPGTVLYQYRLQGSRYDVLGNLWADRDEEHISRERMAVYKDLSAGRFLFTVRAAAGEGNWNTQAAVSVEVYIRQPFMQSVWFYILLFIAGLAIAAAFFLFIRRRTQEKALLPVWVREEKYRTFKLSRKESRAYLKKLLETMEKEKPYLDEEMTLTRLANKLGIGKEELSQVINRELYLNFNAFLNKYRIEEAKKKLRDPKENQHVILKIAHDVGFNSKSSFNAVFKKMTGMSPSQYREKYQESGR